MMMNKFSKNINLYSGFFAEHVKQQGDSAKIVYSKSSTYAVKWFRRFPRKL
jgi:hypothetical protein